MTKTEIRYFLDKISQENILNAFNVLDENEKSTQSMIRQYVVRNEGKTYPPPETLRIAYENATGEKLPEAFFDNIGEGSEQFKFIRELGFEIVKKEVLNQRNNMENRIVVFKKVPKNEVLDGTEIAIPKFYMDEGLIQDPKTSNKRFETSNKARYYPIKFLYKNIQYNYQIKAYPTSDWRKDRRLIINTSDPIFKDRAEGDFLCFCFDNKIDGESNVIAELIKKDSLDYQLISSKYNAKRGYVLRDPNDKDLIDTIFDKSIEKKIKKPLNQILFGPPGTGKTDATVEKALDILDLKTDDRVKNREVFRSLLNKKIFFVTMHPSYSYEDFLQGIKPKTSDKDELLFEPKSGIFKIVSGLALTNFKAELINKKPSESVDFDFVFNHAFNALLDDNEPVLIERGGNDFKIIAINDKTLKFETSTGNTGPTYNLSRATIRKIYDKGENDIILSGNKGYFDSILEFLKIKKAELIQVYKEQKFDNNNYVLILDEINRANISKVFGELITLLEEDKRIGKENELSVTLPSGEIFSVPPNLYIIGTMNTADKSIALVDIALRRRFQFIPVYPDSSVIANYCKSDDKAEKASFMDSLNTRLRVDKGVDFQIGHAYFLKENSLADVINENIIPLLVEYLRNDLEKVKKLLSDLGKPLDEDYYNKTGLLKYIG